LFAVAALPCSCRHTQDAANVVTRASHRADCAASECGCHFEIEIVFRIERSATNQSAECGQYGVEIIRAESRGRHVNVCSEFFYFEILARLEPSKRRNWRHLRSKVKPFELCGKEADVAIGDKLVGRTFDVQIRADVSRV